MHRAFQPEGENVWVPVISKQAGSPFIPECKPPRFRPPLLSLIFQNKSRKKYNLTETSRVRIWQLMLFADIVKIYLRSESDL
jgi:hypothetical protein